MSGHALNRWFSSNVSILIAELSALLSDVAYDETEAGMILRNAWKCLRTNGRLILRGYYFDPSNSNPLFGALFVIKQLIINPNREIIALPSLKGLIEEIEYIITKVSSLTERSFTIIATTPAG